MEETSFSKTMIEAADEISGTLAALEAVAEESTIMALARTEDIEVKLKVIENEITEIKETFETNMS